MLKGRNSSTSSAIVWIAISPGRKEIPRFERFESFVAWDEEGEERVDGRRRTVISVLE